MAEKRSIEDLLNIYTPKIILPGEYGITIDGKTPIGTFAVGAKDGCRGYLLIEENTKYAAVAHIDFLELDLDALIIMKKMLGDNGFFRLGFTPNTHILDSILNIFGNNCFPIELPQFIYFPLTGEIYTARFPQKYMREPFERRKKFLNERLRRNDRSLIMV